MMNGILDLQKEIERLNTKYVNLKNIKDNHSIKECILYKLNEYNKELKYLCNKYNYNYDKYVLHLNNCVMYDIINNK